MSSSLNSYQETLNNIKSEAINAALILTEPRTNRAEISVLQKRIQKQFAELEQFKENPDAAPLIAKGSDFIKLLLNKKDYSAIATMACNIEDTVDSILNSVPKEKVVVLKDTEPKIDYARLNLLSLHIRSVIGPVKKSIDARTDDDKKDALALKNAKIATIQRQVSALDAFQKFEECKELIEQISLLISLISKGTTILKDIEHLVENIATLINKIITKTTVKEKLPPNDLAFIPPCLQEKRIQDELAEYFSSEMKELIRSPNFSPLLKPIKELFTKLLYSEDFYSKDEIDHILTETTSDHVNLLLLILIEAVKSKADLSTLGLFATSTEEEKALFTLLKDLSYSDIGNYVTEKSKTLIDAESDLTLKKALGQRIHNLKREEFNRLMEYISCFYHPPTTLLTATVMNTEDSTIKKKLLRFLSEDKQKLIEKIQDFLDETDAKKYIELTVNLIKNESTVLEFLRAIPFLAARDESQIKKLLSVIFSPEVVGLDQDFRPVISVFFRKIAEKSVDKAVEYLDFLDANYGDQDVAKDAVISVVLAVSHNDAEKSLEIALESKYKNDALNALFESLGSGNLEEGKKLLLSIKNTEDYKSSFIAFVEGVCIADPDKAIELTATIEDAEFRSDCYHIIIQNIIDRDRELLRPDIDQAIALTSRQKKGSEVKDIFAFIIGPWVAKADIDKAVQIVSEISQTSKKLRCYNRIFDQNSKEGHEQVISAILKYEEDADFKAWAKIMPAIVSAKDDHTNIDQVVDAIKALKDDGQRQQAIDKMVLNICFTDVDKAMKLVDNFFISSEKRDFAKYYFLEMLQGSSIEKALQVAQTIENKYIQTSGIKRIHQALKSKILELAPDSPDEALEILKKYPDLHGKTLMHLRMLILKAYLKKIIESIKHNDGKAFEAIVKKVEVLVSTEKDKEFCYVAFSSIFSILDDMTKHVDHAHKLKSQLINISIEMEEASRVATLRPLARTNPYKALELLDTYKDFSDERRDYCKILIAAAGYEMKLAEQFDKEVPDYEKIKSLVNSSLKIFTSLTNKQSAFKSIKKFFNDLYSKGGESLIALLPTLSLSGIALEAAQSVFIDKAMKSRKFETARDIINMIEDEEIKEEHLRALSEEIEEERLLDIDIAIKHGKFDKARDIINAIDDEEIRQELLQALQEELETAATTESSPKSESGSEEI